MTTTFSTLDRSHKGSTARAAAHLPRSLRRAFPGIKKMVDATEAVMVTVRPRDCGRAATPGDPAGCAMARAFARQHDADGVVVGLSRSYVVTGDTVVRFITPPSVAREITSFDRNADFEPGNYHLSPVGKASKYGARRNKGGSNKGRGRPRIVHKATVRVRALKS